MAGAVLQPWARSATELAEELGVDPAVGLSAEEAAERLRQHGPNRLRELRPTSAWSVLAKQFVSWIMALLALASLVSFGFGEWLDGSAILLVLLLNGAIGFFTELKAVRSMEALRTLGSVETRVLRAAAEGLVPAQELVPGDLLVLEAGDVVAADARLVASSNLEVDESALTGESVPVAKSEASVPTEAPLAEHGCLLHKGTAVTAGSATALVVSTGMETELGRIARLVQEADKQATPLEKQLASLGRWLIAATVGIAVLTTLMGIAGGKPMLLMIETGVALAVAAIPEGLPVVATLALARGMWRMARRSVLINRLAAVETLGATTVVFSDKTGTLTENRMEVERLVVGEAQVLVQPDGGGPLTLDGQPLPLEGSSPVTAAIECAVLCNNASLGEDHQTDLGDPTELAMLRLGALVGLDRAGLLERAPEVREVAFDSRTLMMATVHGSGDVQRVAVKGAVESVLAACTQVLGLDDRVRELSAEDRHAWSARAEALAQDGLRVLALAERREVPPEAEVYESLVLLGLIGLADPPRPEVREALAACRRAGVDVIMVTGDHPGTAAAIAKAVGLVDEERPRVRLGAELTAGVAPGDTRLFARVSPEQKLDLIAAYQAAGAVVAMTGDGVNDAPALRKADIGVAMGRRGTQVAREAADMVLLDDAFESIVAALEQGRVIFDNIRRFVFYLLSCNVSEVGVVTVASLLDGPLPLLPLQILFLNLVTDVFPALALAFGEGDRAVLERPPRDPAEPILTRRGWLAIFASALVISMSVLGALGLSLHWLGHSEEQAVTVSFLTLAAAQLWHVFNTRARGSSFVRNEVSANPWVWGALVICFLLLIAAVYLPGLSQALETQALDAAGYGLVLGMSLVPLLVGQVFLAINPRRR